MKELARVHTPVVLVTLFLIAGSFHVLGWYFRLLRPSSSTVTVPQASTPSRTIVPRPSSPIGADLYEKLKSAKATTTVETYQNPFE